MPTATVPSISLPLPRLITFKSSMCVDTPQLHSPARSPSQALCSKFLSLHIPSPPFMSRNMAFLKIPAHGVLFLASAPLLLPPLLPDLPLSPLPLPLGNSCSLRICSGILSLWKSSLIAFLWRCPSSLLPYPVDIFPSPIFSHCIWITCLWIWGSFPNSLL